MKQRRTPILDKRDEAQVFAELLVRRPAYLASWRPNAGSPGWAVLKVFARYMEVLIERLNQAPDKNLLAFLEVLGINLIPARAARAPVVFRPLPQAVDGRIPAGMRVGAEIAGREEPILFETERSVAMAAARLVEVKTLWPLRDEYADHSAAVTGRRPFTLFDSRKPVPHELYLAHDTLLAFTGKATIEVELDLQTGGSEPLRIAWEHWDGQVWRPFRSFDASDPKASQDGTNGLKRSGTATLHAECGKSVAQTIHGIKAHWIRGRLDQPLPPDPTRVLPTVDRVGLRVIMQRKFSGTQQLASLGLSSDGALQPDHAFGNGSKLDLTKIFYPFGRSPDLGSAFYFASEEVFSKPGAEVTVYLRRAITPGDEADEEGKRLDVDVNQARKGLIQAARDAAQGVYDAAKKIADLLPANQLPEGLGNSLKALEEALKDFPDGLEFMPYGTFPDKLLHLHSMVKEVASELGKLKLELPLPKEIKDCKDNESDCKTKWHEFYDKWYEAANSAAKQFEAILNSLSASKDKTGLATLGPQAAAFVTGTPKPALTPPRLIWEYWDGSRWSLLIAPSDKAENNLWFDDPAVYEHPPLKKPEVVRIAFRVPEDLASKTVGGVSAQWVRARIEGGGYERLRMVSWYDHQAGKINFFPIIVPRPPALDMFSMSYVYRSSQGSGSSVSAVTGPSQSGNGLTGVVGASSLPPEHCVARNDFRFELHSDDARWPGRFFVPFLPVTDTTPALYLGFDKPLPNDLISLYLDLEESNTPAPALVWEGWDGERWQALSAEDETGNLRRPGMVSFIASKVKPRPQASVLQAADTHILVTDAVDAAVLQPGEQVVVGDGKTQELAMVRQVDGARLTVESPLSRGYTGGTVMAAALPRFSEPRDWVRARLEVDGKPAKSRFDGIYLNAAWVIQRNTIENEVLGSGAGQLSQSFFFSQIPVLPGERIEVRELEGGRAAVESPMLKEELLEQGFCQEDVHEVTDPRTGRVSEVWVAWRYRPHLMFSGPDDRHYTLERSRGRLIFGDGRHGRMPPTGSNNIRARRYRAGGGALGNVATGAISQLLGAAPYVQSVTNPRPADGGADGESPAVVRDRGPRTLRHRWRAVSASDYEALAREASPAVAAARALPTTAPNGRPAAGWVTVIIVPRSQEARPQPSYELRRQVHAHLWSRAPATVLAQRVAVIGPTYLPVGVAATVAPLDSSQAGAVQKQVDTRLREFLHPLNGGPEGCGWPFGRNVYVSDMAAVLEALPGVDYVERLELLLNDMPQGDVVEVPLDRMVVAGALRIEMTTPEGSRGMRT